MRDKDISFYHRRYLFLRRNKSVLFLFLIISILMLGGCNTLGKNKNYAKAYSEWSRTMGQLGIFPIFPPREDVQVGDVYMLPAHPLDTSIVEAIGGLGVAGIWLHSASIKGTFTTKLEDFYTNRASLPSLRLSEPYMISNCIGTLSVHAVPTYRTGTSTFRRGDVHRLRQVAFPEFSFSNMSQIDLNAIVPVEYLSVAGAYSSSKLSEITLKIPSAESYGLPAKELLKEFLGNKCNGSSSVTFVGKDEMYLKPWDSECDGKNEEIGIPGLSREFAVLSKAMFNEEFNMLSKNTTLDDDIRSKLKKAYKKNKKYLWATVISEVFYARSIDISVHRESSQGVSVEAEPVLSQVTQNGNMLRGILDLFGRGREGGERSDRILSDLADRERNGEGVILNRLELERNGRTREFDIFERRERRSARDEIERINKQLEKSSSIVGGSVKVVSTSNSTVGLRRHFDKPIAVGARGMIIRIDVSKPRDSNGFKIFLQGYGDNDATCCEKIFPWKPRTYQTKSCD